MLLSVIIPCYNVAPYLDECFEALMLQKNIDLEIICVDDCSTDSGLEILEKYAQKDKRIKVIKNDTNRGVGASRNEGLKIAQGKYIHFLDPDDALEDSAYDSLLNIQDTMPDIVRFRYYTANSKLKNKRLIDYSKTTLLEKFVNLNNNPQTFEDWNTSACVCIYNRDFLNRNDIIFNTNPCHEDVEFSLKTLFYANNIIFLNSPIITYRCGRNNSITSKRLFNTDCLVKDCAWVNSQTKNSSMNIKIILLGIVYELLIINTVDAYYAKVISFDKLKYIIKSLIDFSVLENCTKPSQKWCCNIAKRIISYNKTEFFISYNLKRFIKENFPFFRKYYCELKKKVWTQK